MANKQKIRNILITGGAGFIGSNLAHDLLNDGYYVRVLDNFSTGKMDNIRSLIGHKNFHLIEGDIRSIEICMEACSGIDIIFHEAALGSVTRSVNDPIVSNDVNLNGMLNMLIAARDNYVRKFIYASSSSVYGDISSPFKTEGVEGNLLSPYAITKKSCEYYANIFYKLFDLKTIGLRYFNVFGERQDSEAEYAAVIPLFFKAALNGEKVVIYGDGNQQRDFTYISNVIQANKAAMTIDQENYGEIFNVGCGKLTSVAELAGMIFRLVGRPLDIDYQKERKGDIRNAAAKIDKIQKKLGYQPIYSIEEGLKMTLAWYHSHA